ncbi:MAG: HAMP domain-containing sensor histidine kinase [Mariprofundaceae bacterium]
MMADLSERSLTVSNEDIKQLMYVFSHDLRNPLVNMRALMNDLQVTLSHAGDDAETIREAVQEDVPETLAMMDAVVLRMNELITGANGIYHGMFDMLEYEQVELADLVHREIQRRKDALDALNIAITVKALSKVWGDSLLVGQMIGVLLDNVLAFAGEGSDVSLHTEKRKGMDVLVMRDNGKGINGSDLSRIFQPFFSTDTNHHGMGLALLKAWVQAHAGKVWCESVLAEGSVFYIGLPEYNAPHVDET